MLLRNHKKSQAGLGWPHSKSEKEEPMAKKVVIDAEECVACGTCVEIAPEVFKLEEGADHAEVIKGSIGSSEEDAVQEAIDSCPTQCIHWEE